MSVAAALVGLVVGTLVGMTSTGGGALLTPALVLFLAVPPSRAIGTDLFIAACMKVVAGGVYTVRRQVHWPTVGWLALGSVPGATLGVGIMNLIPVGRLETVLRPLLGLTLVIAGASTFIRMHRGTPVLYAPRRLVTIGLGLGTGLLVALTSIGSGSLLLAVLASWFPFDPRMLVGTDLVHALLLSAVAAAGHQAAGRVDTPLAIAVLVGAVPGVLLGAQIAGSVGERMLRRALAVLLILIGLQFASPPAWWSAAQVP